MTNITRRPIPASSKPAEEDAVVKFIAGAPDAAQAAAEAQTASHAHSRKMAGKQAQITLALPPELLDKVDQMAGRLSISRAAFIKMALTRAVVKEGN